MGIHRLPDPPCSSYLAPRDFWFFRYIKVKLEGILFDAPAAFLAEIEEMLGGMSIAK
jgi:hypothetical protein